MVYPIFKRSAEYQEAFTEKFHTENSYPDHVTDVTAVFVAKIKTSEYCIVGWYRYANLFLSGKIYIRSNTLHYVSCDTKDAVLLPSEDRPQIDLPAFSEFLFPPEALRRATLLKIAVRKNKPVVDIHLPISAAELVKRALPEAQEKLLNEYLKTSDAGSLPQIYGHAKEWAQREPGNATPWSYMSRALLDLGRPEEALECCEKILALKTDEAVADAAVKNKGECLIRLQRYMEAAECFRSLLERDPEEGAKISLADCYWHAGYPGIAYGLLKELKSSGRIKDNQAFITYMERNMPYLVKENQELSVLASHPIYIPFSKEPLPRTDADDNGVSRFLDPVRQKYVQITPEETIRQHVISYLMNQIGVPRENILVEESLAHLDKELKHRVDVLVWYLEENKRKNLLLVECKKSGVSLEGETTEQALTYNKYLAAPFILLTNDAQSLVYHYSKTAHRYEALQTLPSFEEMCAETGVKKVPRTSTSWSRPAYDELHKPDFIRRHRQNGDVGMETPDAVAPFILNIKHCLLDDQERISSPLTVPGCVIAEDCGVVRRRLGNATGKGYDGNYRWFDVRDRFGKKRQAYLAVFGTVRYTSLICGVDEGDKIVSKLQIRLDVCLKPQNNGFRLTHNGARSGKPAEPLLKYVYQQVPELTGADGKIDMGWLDGGKNLCLSDAGTADVIGRVISYLLLRSEFGKIS